MSKNESRGASVPLSVKGYFQVKGFVRCEPMRVFVCLEGIKLLWFEGKGHNTDHGQCPHKDK